MEWLVTNGIGGYAAGPISGPLTRRYHGLLVAALEPPLGRTLLVTKLSETLNGAALTDVFRSFDLDVSVPTWRYAVDGSVIEKAVWMEPGANTTYVTYRHGEGTRAIRLDIAAFVNARDHHLTTDLGDVALNARRIHGGVRMEGGIVPYFLLAPSFDLAVSNTWDEGTFLEIEAFRGLDDVDHNLLAVELSITLQPGDSKVIIATTNPEADLDSGAALARRRSHERSILEAANPPDKTTTRLVLAADQFLVRRGTGSTVIAGYHWFGDWGRDTMISLPGLALETGRPEVAAQVLRTYAGYVDRGMIPNHFPEHGPPEYNTVDATLWYVEALHAYHEQWPEDGLLDELFPIVEDIIRWHMAGTRHGILADPADGLLTAGEPGTQLTWMDARVEGGEVTPRIGKPVEINALWYQALCATSEFARSLGTDASRYEEAAEQVRKSFRRFLNPATGHLFDVIDGPEGSDPLLRPNQLFAVSLSHSPLDAAWQRAVVDACTEHLLTPMGVRTLAPFEPGYKGRFGGGPAERDNAYHQGTVWPWLIGPFVRAHLRVYGDVEAIRRFVAPLITHMLERGTITECAEGDPPHAARGAFAQAWSVAEMLRVWRMLGVVRDTTCE